MRRGDRNDKNHASTLSFIIEVAGEYALLFANAPDAGEILFSVTSAITPDTMPSGGGAIPTSITYNQSITTSGVATVTATIDTGAYATAAQAVTAQATADAAKTTANAAQTTAQTALTNAATAQSTANSAKSTANQALTLGQGSVQKSANGTQNFSGIYAVDNAGNAFPITLSSTASGLTFAYNAAAKSLVLTGAASSGEWGYITGSDDPLTISTSEGGSGSGSGSGSGRSSFTVTLKGNSRAVTLQNNAQYQAIIAYGLVVYQNNTTTPPQFSATDGISSPGGTVSGHVSDYALAAVSFSLVGGIPVFADKAITTDNTTQTLTLTGNYTSGKLTISTAATKTQSSTSVTLCGIKALM